MSLTNQNEVIQSLINDPELKPLAAKKLQDQIDAAKDNLAKLERAYSELCGSSKRQPTRTRPTNKTSSKALPGSKNHRLAIVGVINSKPGMIISEVREALAAAGHEIDNKTLASLICTMAKSEKEIVSSGNRPNTKYFPTQKKDWYIF